MSDKIRVRREIDRFPTTFGLRAFPGRQFTINEGASYVTTFARDETCGAVMLYVYTEDGKAFSKAHPSELRSEIVV